MNLRNLNTSIASTTSSMAPSQHQSNNNIPEDVIKFLLKLKNNNIQNLKNALRKLGERTIGNKEQLLIRLANKLATPEGRQLVRANFKPEIYRQLYEVEINGNYQHLVQQVHNMNGGTAIINSNQIRPNQGINAQINPQKRSFLNMNDAQNQIQGNFGSIQSNGINGMHSNGMISTQPVIQQQQNPFQFTQPTANIINPNVFKVNQNGIQQQQQRISNGVQNGGPQNQSQVIDLIEIDSDAASPMQSQMLQQQPIHHNHQQIQQPQIHAQSQPVIKKVYAEAPQQSQENGGGNNDYLLNGNINMNDLQKLPYIKIMTMDKYPCVLDEEFLAGKSNIYCVCDNYNSIYHQNSNQQQLQNLIKCTQCGREQHLICVENNAKMMTSTQGGRQLYVCHHCQFYAIDPFAVPIATLLRPFKIAKLTSQQVKMKSDIKSKEFLVKEHFYQEINKFTNVKQSSLRIQVRCLRLDAVGFEHCWPKFGQMTINGSAHQEYRMPDPPNDQKKRKDEFFDITTSNIKKGKNKIDIFQEQKNHEGFYNHPGHICAIFLVKIVQPHDVINFIKHHRVELPELSLKRAEAFFGKDKNKEDNDIEEIETEFAEQIIINLLCPITYTPIKVPARGELCTHLQCFDIDTYIQSNAQHKRWKCPQCNRRAHHLIIDNYFTKILEMMKLLKEKEGFAIKDKIALDSQLNVCVKRGSDDEVETKYPLIRNPDGSFYYDISTTVSCQTTAANTFSGATTNENPPNEGSNNAQQDEEMKEDNNQGNASNSISKQSLKNNSTTTVPEQQSAEDIPNNNNPAQNNKKNSCKNAIAEPICLDSDGE